MKPHFPMGVLLQFWSIFSEHLFLRTPLDGCFWLGSDSAPFFANLFLHYYENTWIKKVKKNDIWQARRFSKLFRFIDELNALNNFEEFEQSFKETYPPELILKKQNVSSNEGSFLYLFVKIGNNQFSIDLYDKSNDLPISKTRMPYLWSNDTLKMSYSAYGSEIWRTARTTCKA